MLSFYKTEPRYELTEIGNADLGIIELPRYNSLVPEEQEHYFKQVDGLQDFEEMASDLASKLVGAFAKDDEKNSLFNEDITDMIVNQEDHTEFIEEISTDFPDLWQEFVNSLNQMTSEALKARVLTMLQVRLANTLDPKKDKEALADLAKITSKDIENPRNFKPEFIVRIHSFFLAEIANDSTLDYDIFSCPTGEFLDPKVIQRRKAEAKEAIEE